MRSLKIILIRNFVGLIFAILLVVFLLFNILTNNFISAEANRELLRSVANIEASTNRLTHPFGDGWQPSIGIIEDVLIQMGSLRQLMLHTDGIIISENDEIVSPNIFTPEGEIAAEIFFLAGFFISNRELFADGAMIRLASESHVYYMMAVKYSIADELAFSVLLYTDITSAMVFMHSVNQILRNLLIVSGVTSILTAFFISSRVQKAIIRLCNYAEVVGEGNFTEKVEGFYYKEFNTLAQSMNNMSIKLNTYENNQKRFFQNASHELRTPLMSIQGYAEGILEDVLDKKEASQIILSEGSRMEGLVKQLLYVSRLDSGLDALNITAFNLKNTLYDCAERIKILANKDKKEIILDFPPGEKTIKSDEEKLQRAIDNILSNCIRHAAAKVTVSYITLDTNVIITIEDDGTGIKEEDLPHIFDRFYKGVNGNSGLGLAICKDIIKKLGGSVKAENTIGAKFTVIIPITSA